MKDKYLYASTFLQGLQVVDLHQAITEFQQTDAATFGQAVSTEGNGFATDTVVNAIQLPVASGGTATMWDLKADDFVLAGGAACAAAPALFAVPWTVSSGDSKDGLGDAIKDGACGSALPLRIKESNKPNGKSFLSW